MDDRGKSRALRAPWTAGIGGALVLAFALAGSASGQETAGKTTVDQRIVPDAAHTQSGGRACGETPCGEGEAKDRNVELLVADPRASTGEAAGRCANALKGTPKRDRLRGTAGGDRIRGRAGADRLNGRSGADCIQGGRGADRITGGRGRDTLKGGGGRDRIGSRDGERDQVRCGSGRDRVKADAEDRIARSCERVRRRS